jgi:hypothetical protein
MLKMPGVFAFLMGAPPIFDDDTQFQASDYQRKNQQDKQVILHNCNNIMYPFTS